MLWKAHMTYRNGNEIWTDVWAVEAINKASALSKLYSIPNKPNKYLKSTSVYELDCTSPEWMGGL